MIFGDTVDAMKNHKRKLRNHDDPIQPFILIVGTIFQQKEIIVYFDSVMYKVHSIIRSLEVCYKYIAYSTWNTASESTVVWFFIQKYFFNYSSKKDKPYHKLSQIISELN